MTIKTIVISGGGGSIGAAAARLYAIDGHHTVLIGRTEAKLVAARQTISSSLVTTIMADPADPAQAKSAIAQILATTGRIDVLVNAAGVFLEPTNIDVLDPADLAQVMSSNFTAPANLCIAACSALKATRGSIVNIAATDAFASTVGYAAECASKGALVAFSRSAAVELGKFGIRVNVVLPGWVRSPMSEPALRAANLLDVPLAIPALGIPEVEDIVSAIRFFTDEQASKKVTGAFLVVDGGHLSFMADARRA